MDTEIIKQGDTQVIRPTAITEVIERPQRRWPKAMLLSLAAVLVGAGAGLLGLAMTRTPTVPPSTTSAPRPSAMPAPAPAETTVAADGTTVIRGVWDQASYEDRLWLCSTYVADKMTEGEGRPLLFIEFRKALKAKADITYEDLVATMDPLCPHSLNYYGQAIDKEWERTHE